MNTALQAQPVPRRRGRNVTGISEKAGQRRVRDELPHALQPLPRGERLRVLQARLTSAKRSAERGTRAARRPIWRSLVGGSRGRPSAAPAGVGDADPREGRTGARSADQRV